MKVRTCSALDVGRISLKIGNQFLVVLLQRGKVVDGPSLHVMRKNDED